jgi:hypothetical protein
MLHLKFINRINVVWNNIIYRIHDILAKCGLHRITVYLHDALMWRLPTKWQVIDNKRYKEYLLECELRQMQHQCRYYANMAYTYMWENYDIRNANEKDSEIVYASDSRKETIDDLDKVGG